MKKSHLIYKQEPPRHCLFYLTRHERCVIVSFLACSLFWFAPLPVYAWGTRAHRIIAHIAASYLSTHTRQEVAKLIDPQSLADIADDADLWRQTRPETGPWHYVNLSFDASQYDPGRDCPNGDCVIAAIAKYREVVADQQHSRALRHEALIFLVHLVADAHQPLHCIDNRDRGGNNVAVTFFGIPTNLHAVWDNELLFRTHLGERAYTYRLLTWLASHDLEALRRGTPVDWVLEAHSVARDYAYQLPDDRNLQSHYYSNNLPILERQLARAGVRLAGLLNEAFQRDGTYR